MIHGKDQVNSKSVDVQAHGSPRHKQHAFDCYVCRAHASTKYNCSLLRLKVEVDIYTGNMLFKSERKWQENIASKTRRTLNRVVD